MATDITQRDAYRILQSGAELDGQSFSILQLISRLAVSAQTEDAARDLLIRALENRSSISPNLYPVLESLTSSLGLFPYLFDASLLSAGEQILLEYHRPPTESIGEFVFHSMQKSVFDRLMNGENLVLSAPTSFGKSAILDSLLLVGRWQNFVVIVPTVALIDEIRRRVTSLGADYKVITHPSQTPSDWNVYVLTQERFLDLPYEISVDFFVIDEFYKLDGRGKTQDARTIQLNIAWDRLRRTGAQYYLIGPNIDGLSNSLPENLRNQLTVTSFRTVAVDDIAVETDDEQGALINLCETLRGPTLIYVRSPRRAREVGEWLLKAGLGANSPSTTAAADWIAENFHPEWVLGRCLRQGIGLHHGRVPRALQHHILRHFNRGEIPFLVCTSTLIEGVNTVAENVVIFDKKIDRSNLDYFTFNNIRGRAGRMLRHFIGKVYAFSQAPEASKRIVDIPITSQSKRMSDSSLLQLPQSELTPSSRARLEIFLNQDVLSLETIRLNRSVAPDRQIRLAADIRANVAYYHPRLNWSGYPDYDQRVEACRIIMEILGSRPIGPATPRSVATRIEQVRRFQASIPQLVGEQVRYSETVDEAVEEVVYFVRNWASFDFPSHLRAIESIQREVFAGRGMRYGSYSFYAAQAEAQFLPDFFSVLEEYGLPYQLAVKLRQYGLSGDSLDGVLARLRQIGRALPPGPEFGAYDREIVSDVLLGLD